MSMNSSMNCRVSDEDFKMFRLPDMDAKEAPEEISKVIVQDKKTEDTPSEETSRGIPEKKTEDIPVDTLEGKPDKISEDKAKGNPDEKYEDTTSEEISDENSENTGTSDMSEEASEESSHAQDHANYNMIDQESIERKQRQECVTICTEDQFIKQHFTELIKIGEGGFGDVYEGRHLLDKKKYAIKFEPVNTQTFSSREIESLSSMEDRNIVKYYTSFIIKLDESYSVDVSDSCNSSDSIQFKEVLTFDACLVTKMELCSRKNLKKEIEIGKIFTEEEWRLYLCLDILRGLKCIHEKGYMHRDLKPDNILINENGTGKIADFGFTRKYLVTKDEVDMVDSQTPEQDANSFTKDLGTSLYVAPEILKENCSYDKKADLYSFGIILFELFHQMASGSERAITLEKLRDQDFSPLNQIPEMYENVKTVVKDLLNHVPSKRMNLDNVIELMMDMMRELENINQLKVQSQNPQKTDFSVSERRKLRREISESQGQMKGSLQGSPVYQPTSQDPTHGAPYNPEMTPPVMDPPLDGQPRPPIAMIASVGMDPNSQEPYTKSLSNTLSGPQIPPCTLEWYSLTQMSHYAKNPSNTPVEGINSGHGPGPLSQRLTSRSDERLHFPGREPPREQSANEFQSESIHYLETIKKQEKQLALLQALLDKIHPMACLRQDCNYYNLDEVKKECKWDDNGRVWILPEVSPKNTAQLSVAESYPSKTNDYGVQNAAKGIQKTWSNPPTLSKNTCRSQTKSIDSEQSVDILSDENAVFHQQLSSDSE